MFGLIEWLIARGKALMENVALLFGVRRTKSSRQREIPEPFDLEVGVSSVAGSEISVLRVWEEDPDDADAVRLELSAAGRTWVGSSPEGVFDALVKLRERLESAGLQINCNGAGQNVYPSPMSISMGGGAKAYRLSIGSPARSAELVNIFELSEGVNPVSLADQKAFYERWLQSLKSA